MFCASFFQILFSLLFLYTYILLSTNDSDLIYLEFYECFSCMEL